VNYKLKEQMMKDQTLEFNWIVSKDQTILTHVLDHHYSAPGGFMWEGRNLKENPPINQSNIDQRSQDLVRAFRARSQLFRTNNVLVPFGDDFQFRNAEINFGNMSLLINYINANKKRFNINVKYALLSEYFDAIKDQASVFGTYNYDFLPYSDNNVSDWTGFYTSRPTLKHLARIAEKVARTSEILFALSQAQSKDPTLFKDSFDRLYELRSANGYVQHHDGITGTETPDVVQMYADYIHTAFSKVATVLDLSLQTLTSKKALPTSLSYIEGRDFRNVPANKFVPIILFNSLGWSRGQVVRLYTSTRNVMIQNDKGLTIPTDINDLGNNVYEVAFDTESPIPALGYETYFLYTGASSGKQHYKKESSYDQNVSTMSNSVYEITFCPNEQNAPKICRIRNKISGVEIKIDQSLQEYPSMAKKDQQNSGAYIFRSDGPKAPVNRTLSTSTFRSGVFVQELEQSINPYAKQTIRLYNSKDSRLQSMNNFIEFEFEIGEVPLDKEVVAVFSTDIASQGQFFSDNNGYQTQKRILNKSLAPSANYVPICASSFILDKKTQFTILTDQTRGLTSLQDGQLEVMLHRRTSHDDSRGLGRPLNDTTVTVVTLRIIVDTPERSLILRHPQSHIQNFPSDVFRIDITNNNWTNLHIENPNFYSQVFNTWYSAVDHDLPMDVHLMTLQAHSREDPSQYLLRLHHIFEENEGNQTESIRVKSWFTDRALKIGNYQETLLSANQAKKGTRSNDSFQVDLKPSQIRTFIFQRL
jgi:hypothetical protein